MESVMGIGTRTKMQGYCENCNTDIDSVELSSRYHEETRRCICDMCVGLMLTRSSTELESEGDITRVFISFEDEVFAGSCIEFSLLSTSIESHGYQVVEVHEDWVKISTGDAVVMKIGKPDNGLNAIHNYILSRLWELYI